MNRFAVKNFGPISNVSVEFGDLTILVGEQASGKSVFLQMLKLSHDKAAIQENLASMSYVWDESLKKLLDLYLGNGMGEMLNADSWFSNPITAKRNGKKSVEKCFYVPAQRILSVPDGRLRAFAEFNSDTPYSLKIFSDDIRRFMEASMSNLLFPNPSFLSPTLNSSIANSIFHSGNVKMATDMGQRKMVMDIDHINVPFMSWSAGQKEFMPLLLAFCRLAHDCASKNPTIHTVIIEEPEMGLHPKAILSIIHELVALLHNGYKVIVSTHSDVILEFAWAFSMISRIPDQNIRIAALNSLLDKNDESPEIRSLSDKTIRTYAFVREQQKVTSRDITRLDAFDMDTVVSEWGGLSTFAEKSQSVVAQYAQYL